MTRTNRIPVSLRPKTSTERGTQQTLGKVCKPRKKPPNVRSSASQRQSASPHNIPRSMLMTNPTTKREMLMASATGSAKWELAPSSAINDSMTWLGAGNIHGFHPMRR